LGEEVVDEDIQTLRGTRDAYEKLWKSVDGELYELCQRRTHDAFADVFTKVSIINRVYQAGLLRTLGRDGERKVAEVLVENSATIEEWLSRLRSDGQLEKETAAEAIEAHGEITSLIADATNRKWVVSFVSKYLHFHRASVPIYDTWVEKAIRRRVSATHARGAREALPQPSTGFATKYYEFVCRFLVLYEDLESREPDGSLTVKGLDTMLWDPVTADSR
jgi:hypothetical protein